jgi:hypothetical protein
MRAKPLLAIAMLAGAGLALVAPAPASAQDEDIYRSPSVDFYINRVRGQDRVNVSLQNQISRDVNSRPGGGISYQPGFLQGGGGGGGPAAAINKPFSNASHRPTVSPYLNLLRDELSDETIPNYHTLVRPQMEQIQFQQTQQRQNDLVYRQLQQIQAQAGFNPQGSEVMLPTGHSTTFQYYGSYYPMPGRRR